MIDDFADECCICLDASVAITFVPCNHRVTCKRCSEKLKLCPICRRNILAVIKTEQKPKKESTLNYSLFCNFQYCCSSREMTKQ